MLLRIISPTANLFEGEVTKVLLPGAKAPFVVLRSHAPLISSLTSGRVVFTKADGSEERVEVGGGFVEVREDTIVVCTE